MCSALFGVIFCLAFDPFFLGFPLLGVFLFIHLFNIILAFHQIEMSVEFYIIIITLGLIHEDEHGTNAKRLKLGTAIV